MQLMIYQNDCDNFYVLIGRTFRRTLVGKFRVFYSRKRPAEDYHVRPNYFRFLASFLFRVQGKKVKKRK